MDFGRDASAPRNSLAKLRSRFDRRRRERTYILPTGYGLLFALTAFCLFLMALGSNNNLLYLFVFFTIAVGLSSMVLTNRNIERVTLAESSTRPGFAGEDLRWTVTLRNTQVTPSLSLEIAPWGSLTRGWRWAVGGKAFSEVRWVHVPRLEAFEEKTVDLLSRPLARGRHKLPQTRLQSRFPFGLLRSWKTLWPGAGLLVYPARKGSPYFPWEENAGQSAGDPGLFLESRELRPGDSPRRIDWRTSARHQDLFVKNFEPANEPAAHFTWAQTRAFGDDFEARLSQLTLWLDQAEKRGLVFSMDLGRVRLDPSRGPAHLARCLEILADITPGEIE